MSDADAQPARSAGALRWANEQRVLDVLRQPGEGDADGHAPHTQADIARAWKHVLGGVRGFQDLDPALLGRVEELIDFVTA